MQSLASLEEKINPGQLESDKDRLLLINEKEHLLRELRSISSRTRSIPELEKLKAQCSRLEQDLNEAQEMSNRCIAGKCCSLELIKNNCFEPNSSKRISNFLGTNAFYFEATEIITP